MKNIITATIEFCFKGERFTPSVTLDLGEHLKQNAAIPDLHALIARENNIDLYSYEYEMMLVEEIRFSQAEGLVTSFIRENRLDVDAFVQAWQEQNTLQAIQKIVEQNMALDDIETRPGLKQTLLDVYRLGLSDK